MKTLTLEEAKNLKHGDILYHTINCNADGTAQRWKVNGKAQTWKRDPKKVKIPVKNGLKKCDYITENDLWLVSFWNWKKFTWIISEAQKFQRQMRNAGYKTRLVRYAGIANPYCIVEFRMITK